MELQCLITLVAGDICLDKPVGISAFVVLVFSQSSDVEFFSIFLAEISFIFSKCWETIVEVVFVFNNEDEDTDKGEIDNESTFVEEDDLEESETSLLLFSVDSESCNEFDKLSLFFVSLLLVSSLSFSSTGTQIALQDGSGVDEGELLP